MLWPLAGEREVGGCKTSHAEAALAVVLQVSLSGASIKHPFLRGSSKAHTNNSGVSFITVRI